MADGTITPSQVAAMVHNAPNTAAVGTAVVNEAIAANVGYVYINNYGGQVVYDYVPSSPLWTATIAALKAAASA